MTAPSRGDVVRVSFPDDEDIPDEEFDGPHPAVVLQNDGLNERKDTVVVIPVSSGSNADALSEVKLQPGRDGVENESIAKLHQITTVSISERIVEGYDDESAWKEGEVSAQTLSNIENYLGYVLEI